jgi:hypothetical protein
MKRKKGWIAPTTAAAVFIDATPFFIYFQYIESVRDALYSV